MTVLHLTELAMVYVRACICPLDDWHFADFTEERRNRFWLTPDGKTLDDCVQYEVDSRDDEVVRFRHPVTRFDVTHIGENIESGDPTRLALSLSLRKEDLYPMLPHLKLIAESVICEKVKSYGWKDGDYTTDASFIVVFEYSEWFYDDEFDSERFMPGARRVTGHARLLGRLNVDRMPFQVVEPTTQPIFTVI